MQTKIRGINQAGSEVDLEASEGGFLGTIPHNVLWTAKGYSRTAMSTTAVAGLVVRPTTTALVSLYNIGTSNNLVIERAFAHELISAAVTTAGLWLCVHPVGTIVAGAANDIAQRGNLSGRAVGDDGYFDIDDTVAAGDWVPWSENYGYVLTVTTPSVVLMANVNGRIIIPPTAGVSLQVVASVNTATFTAGFHWFSVPATELAVA